MPISDYRAMPSHDGFVQTVQRAGAAKLCDYLVSGRDELRSAGCHADLYEVWLNGEDDFADGHLVLIASDTEDGLLGLLEIEVRLRYYRAKRFP